MSIKFNADEVFTMAATIGKKCAGFYKTAAENATDPKSKAMLQRLAKQEFEHEKKFAQMRERLSDEHRASTAYDPDNEEAPYLHQMVEENISEWQHDPCVALDGSESTDMVLHKAIELEKDAVLFFLTMKEMVPHKQGKDEIDEIISEDLRHISRLKKGLKSRK